MTSRTIRQSLLAAAVATALPALVQAAPAPDAEPRKERARERLRERKLERVEVEGPYPAPFAPSESTTGLKSPAPLRDVPQSVTVVPPAVIETQAATTLSEALRNVAGLTLASGEGGFTGDSITLRGFAARTDQYLDGVRDNGQYVRDTFNVERVEVLKGASSMLFGRGGTGGVVNSISKKPSGDPLRVVTLMGGSESFGRATLDVDQPIGDRAGVRVNALWQDSDSFRDEVTNRRTGLAASARFEPGVHTTVDLEGYGLEHDGVLDYGIPMNRATGEPVDVPLELHYGAGAQSIYRVDVAEARVRVEHEFGGGAILRNTTAVGEYDRLYRVVRPNAITDATPDETVLVTRNHILRGGEQENLFNVTDLLFDLEAGGIRHELYAGLELAREDFVTKDRAGLPALPAVPLFDPGSVVLEPLPDSLDGPLSAHNVVDTSTTAISVQDRLLLGHGWSVVGGLRHERFDAELESRVTGAAFAREDEMTSWRLGAVYQPSDEQSYYALASTSQNPSAETFSLNAATAALDPERNRNYELGAKFTPFGERLAFNVALFRLEKTDARTVDPANTSVQVLDGVQRSDGIELELQGTIARGWKIFAGAAWMDPEIVESNNVNNGVAIEGNRPQNAPRFAANLWTVKQLGHGFEIGAGAFHVGERYADTGNTLRVPEYTRYDAYLGWTGGAWRVALNAYNLGNERYFEYAHPVFATPGAPRNYRVSVTYAF